MTKAEQAYLDALQQWLETHEPPVRCRALAKTIERLHAITAQGKGSHLKQVHQDVLDVAFTLQEAGQATPPGPGLYQRGGEAVFVNQHGRMFVILNDSEALPTSPHRGGKLFPYTTEEAATVTIPAYVYEAKD